ncbi:unnamed protein product [Coccothraustes coccothraustes]
MTPTPPRWPPPRRYLRGEGSRRVPPPSLDPPSLFFGGGPARSSRCPPRKDRGSRLPSYPWPLRERGPGTARSPGWERSRRSGEYRAGEKRPLFPVLGFIFSEAGWGGGV